MRALVFLFFGAIAACSSSAPATTEPQGNSPPSAQARFDHQKDVYYQATLDAAPGLAVRLGYHQYDGKLPDISAQAIAERVRSLHQAEETFAAIPAAELTRTARIEREVLLAHIRGALFDLETMAVYQRNPIAYMRGFNLSSYIERDYAPLPERAAAITRMCDSAEGYVAQAMDNLQPDLPRTFLATALLQTNGMIAFIKKDVREATQGLDADASATLDASLGRCVQALTSYKTFLEQRQAQATDDFALGEARFLQMLRDKEGVDITIERLQAIGEADLARNQAALEAAAKQIAAGATIPEVLAMLGKNKPAVEEMFALATEQAKTLRALLIDEQIVSIPSDDVAEVRPSPPFMRYNSAFLNSAGPFEKKPLPSFYYISPPDPTWSPEVQRDYIPLPQHLLFTTVHELWPGHFLHALHKKQNPSRILKTFCTYSMTEGWAHYAEEMMWQQGAGDGDPRAHVGQILKALLRDVRYLSAIGLHARGMTVDASMALFKERAYADQGTALQQARRGTFDPGYLNYTLGKLMIKKLRADWEAKVGDAYSLQAFHDEFLSYGCAPVPVIRAFMLGDNAGPAL